MQRKNKNKRKENCFEHIKQVRLLLFSILLIITITALAIPLSIPSADASLYDARVISGADYNAVLEKTYKDSVYAYYDNGGNENGGIGIKAENVCADICNDKTYDCEIFGCSNPYYMAAVIKMGNSIMQISDTIQVMPTKKWSGAQDSAYADISFNNANAPAQIQIVVSKDQTITTEDLFYPIDATQNGWLKGKAPTSNSNSSQNQNNLHSYELTYWLDGGTTIAIKVDEIYANENYKIETTPKLLIGIAKTDKLSDNNFLDVKEARKGETVKLDYNQHTGETYIFVNGIPETAFNAIRTETRQAPVSTGASTSGGGGGGSGGFLVINQQANTTKNETNIQNDSSADLQKQNLETENNKQTEENELNKKNDETEKQPSEESPLYNKYDNKTLIKIIAIMMVYISILSAITGYILIKNTIKPKKPASKNEQISKKEVIKNDNRKDQSRNRQNKKPILIILLITSFITSCMLIAIPNAEAALSDARLISGSTYNSPLNKTYNTGAIHYGDSGGNENGGIGIYSTDTCNDFCTDNPSDCESFGCSNAYSIAAAVKVGGTYKLISDVQQVSLGTSNWGSGFSDSATADVNFNNAHYPGQIYIAVSSDGTITSADAFYPVYALNAKGWLKGDAPGSIPTVLHSYNLTSQDINTTIRVNVSSAYAHDGTLITHSETGSILVGISRTNQSDNTTAFINSTEVSRGAIATLGYGSNTGMFYIFVNGILEGNITGSGYNYAPNVTLVSPANNTIFNETNDITLYCNATDPSGIKNLTLYTNISGTFSANYTNTTIGTASVINYTIQDLANGTYLWNCLAYDNSEEVLPAFAGSNRSFTVNYTSTTNNAPNINLSNPANNTYTNATLTAFIINTSDDTGLANMTLYIWNTTGLFQRNTSTFTGLPLTNSTTLLIELTANMVYRWTAVVFDASGLSTWAAINWTITIDNTAPTVALNLPIDGFNTSLSTINFNWTATDNLDAQLICNLTINSSISASGITSNSGTTASQAVGMGEGTHYWNVTCWDDGGNINTSSTSQLNLDFSAPAISNVRNDSITNTTVNVTWTTNENANATIRYGSSPSSLTNTKSHNQFTTAHNVTLTNLANGTTYYYNITSCDIFGNCNASGPYNFITAQNYDLAAPLITNVRNTTITNTTAAINWTTNEISNTTVNYGTSTNLGNYTTNGSYVTNHEIIIAGLTNGTLYYYNATSCDQSGNCNTSGTYNFTTLQNYDLAAPIVFLISPANNTIIANTTQAFVFNFTDELSQNAPCSLFVNNVKRGENLSVLKEVETTITNNTLPEGSNQWYVNCTDNSNNTGKSQVRNLTVDTIKPAITIVSPQNITYNNQTILVNISANDTRLDKVWFFNGTANQTYTTPIYVNFNESGNIIIAYANDTAGNINQTTVAFTIDTILPGITIISPQNTTYNNRTILVNISTTGASSIWFYNGTTNQTYTVPIYVNFNEGTNALLAYSNDSAGNLNTSSIQFTIDTIAPTITIVSPQNMTYNDTNILINISTTGAANTWFYNGTANQTYTTPTYITFNEGGNLLIGYTNDSIGNLNQSSIAFTIDSTPPILSNLNSTTTNTTANVSWSTDENANTTIKYGTTTAFGTTISNASLITTHNMTITGLTNGTTYYYNITACDQQRNCLTYGIYNLTTQQNYDVAPPVISNVRNDTITNTTVNITWTTNENANATIKYGTNPTTLTNTTSVNQFTTAHNITLTNLANGTTYYYNITSCDISGNCIEQGAYAFTTLAFLDNIAPTVNLITPQNNANTSNQTQAFIFNFTDNYAQTANCYLHLNNILSGENSSAATNTPTTITNNTLTEGTNRWYVNCTDSYNNVGQSAIRTITLDTTGPNITIISPSENSTIAGNITITANASDQRLSIVSYELRNGSISSNILQSGTMNSMGGSNNGTYNATINTNDTWPYDSNAQSTANLSIIVYANDSLGNIRNSSISFFVDNTKPSISYFNTTTITNESAIIAINTTEQTNATITYGTSVNNLSSSSSNSSLSASHQATLTGLRQKTRYHYNITICDSPGNCRTNGTYNFTTNKTYDSQPPVIHNILFTPEVKMLLVNESINISINATDNINIDSYDIQMTTPNNSIQTFNSSEITNYNATIFGMYLITIIITDDYGNNISRNDAFIAGTSKVPGQDNLIGQNGTLTGQFKIYIHNTSYVLSETSMNGSKINNYTTGFLLDYEYIPEDTDIRIIIKGVNESTSYNRTLKFERIVPANSGFIATIGVESTYNSTKGIRIVYNYTNISYNNEDNLKVHKCNDWNFTLGTCYGSWVDITSMSNENTTVTHNTTANTFIIDVNSLSGFSIKEITPTTTTQTSGGGSSAGTISGGGAIDSQFLKSDFVINTGTLIINALEGEEKEANFEITNTGQKGINIRTKTESQYVTLLPSEFSINPGRNATIKITIIAPEQFGTYNAAIKIYTTDENGAKIEKELKLEIKVTPKEPILVKSVILQKTVNQGAEIISEIEITKKILTDEIKITYGIKNSNNIIEKTEILSMEQIDNTSNTPNTIKIQRSINSQNTEPGEYEFFVKVEEVTGKYSAIASEIITIGKAPEKEKPLIIPSLIPAMTPYIQIATLAILFAIIALVLFQVMRKGDETEIEEAKGMPKETSEKKITKLRIKIEKELKQRENDKKKLTDELEKQKNNLAKKEAEQKNTAERIKEIETLIEDEDERIAELEKLEPQNIEVKKEQTIKQAVQENNDASKDNVLDKVVFKDISKVLRRKIINKKSQLKNINKDAETDQKRQKQQETEKISKEETPHNQEKQTKLNEISDNSGKTNENDKNPKQEIKVEKKEKSDDEKEKESKKSLYQRAKELRENKDLKY